MKKYNHWSKEKCHNEALKYTTKIDYKNNSNNSYSIACKNKWIIDICSHMIPKRDKYNIKICREEALKYNTINEFFKKSNKIYAAASYHGWLDEICSHMKRIHHKKWSKEDIIKEALKYKSREEFHKKGLGAYQSACKSNFLDEICSHMIPLGNLLFRCIYVFEFDNNYVYVGLTHDINERTINHLTNKNSAVFQHIIKFQIKPNFKQLTDYVDINKAKELESYYVEKYFKEKWNILNKIKTGGIGGNYIKWTKEKCTEEALKYKTRQDFSLNSNAYYTALSRGWLDDICKHMINGRIKWTKEKCIEEANKYLTKKDFKSKSNHAYSACVFNKWLNEVYKHMLKA